MQGVKYNLLMEALRANDPRLALLLVLSGADVNYKDSAGNMSPLILAASNGMTAVVEALVRKGADVAHKSAAGMTCLAAAATGGHASVIPLLFQGKSRKPEVCIGDADGTTPLMLAAVGGYIDTVNALLQKGACVDQQNSDGHSALMFAHKGKSETVHLLKRLSQGSLKSADSRLLTFAELSIGVYDRVIEVLVQAGAQVLLEVRNY